MGIDIDTLKHLAELSARIPMSMCPCKDEVFISHGDHWSPYYAFLYYVASKLKPKISIELGVHLGMGSGHLCSANPDGIVIGVDQSRHPELDKYAGRFQNFWFVLGDTMRSAHYIHDDIIKDDSIGILFIDSTHTALNAQIELTLYSQWFDDECIVFCDDVAIPAMQGFWEWLPGEKYRCDFLHPRLNTTYDEPGFGVSIIRRQV